MSGKQSSAILLQPKCELKTVYRNDHRGDMHVDNSTIQHLNIVLNLKNILSLKSANVITEIEQVTVILTKILFFNQLKFLFDTCTVE